MMMSMISCIIIFGVVVLSNVNCESPAVACNGNLDVAFLIDSSEMSEKEFDNLKSVLLFMVKLLRDSQAHQQIEIRVALISRTFKTHFFQPYVPLKDEIYLDNVIRSRLPHLRGKFYLLEIFNKEWSNIMKGNRTNRQSLILFTKNSNGIFNNQTWFYGYSIEQFILAATELNVATYLVQFDPAEIFPPYMFSEPACEYNVVLDKTDFSKQKVINMITAMIKMHCTRQFESYNCLTRWKNGSCSVGTLRNLTFLTCDNNVPNNASSFPAEIAFYTNFSTIDIVVLHYYDFEQLPEHVFERFVSRPMQVIIRKCHLRHFKHLNITYFNGLKYLVLDYNKLESIDDYAFSSMIHLKALTMKVNMLRRVNRNTFNGLKTVQTLNLNYNQIGEIEDFAFETLSELMNLTLENNSLQYLTANTFNSLGKLELLSLDNNKLSNMDENVFAPLTNLNLISLNNNQLEFICANLFKPLLVIRGIFLAFNRLKEIDPDAFMSLNSLEFLELGINNLNVATIPRIDHPNLVYLSFQQEKDDAFNEFDERIFSLTNVSNNFLYVLHGNSFEFIDYEAFLLHSEETPFRNFDFIELMVNFITIQRIINTDMCILKYFATQHGHTIFRIFDLKADEKNLSIFYDCKLRVLLARLNIIFRGVTYRSFGTYCSPSLKEIDKYKTICL